MGPKGGFQPSRTRTGRINRWEALTRYASDGTIDIDNNAAQRALRGPVLSRKNFPFAGTNSGGERAAAMYSLLETAKLKGLNPRPSYATSWSVSPITPSTGSTSYFRGTSPRRWKCRSPRRREITPSRRCSRHAYLFLAGKLW